MCRLPDIRTKKLKHISKKFKEQQFNSPRGKSSSCRVLKAVNAPPSDSLGAGIRGQYQEYKAMCRLS